MFDDWGFFFAFTGFSPQHYQAPNPNQLMHASHAPLSFMVASPSMCNCYFFFQQSVFFDGAPPKICVMYAVQWEYCWSPCWSHPLRKVVVLQPQWGLNSHILFFLSMTLFCGTAGLVSYWPASTALCCPGPKGKCWLSWELHLNCSFWGFHLGTDRGSLT